MDKNKYLMNLPSNKHKEYQENTDKNSGFLKAFFVY